MNKVYVVTEGDYSDYHIEACFSTMEKAQEYIENLKKTKQIYSNHLEIEEWNIDGNIDIVDVITINFMFTSPLSKNMHKEKIEYSINKQVRCDVFETTYLWGADYQYLTITRIANPNKDIKDEISRCEKVAYDTAKRIKYLYEVENIKTQREINEML